MTTARIASAVAAVVLIGLAYCTNGAELNEQSDQKVSASIRACEHARMAIEAFLPSPATAVFQPCEAASESPPQIDDTEIELCTEEVFYRDRDLLTGGFGRTWGNVDYSKHYATAYVVRISVDSHNNYGALTRRRFLVFVNERDGRLAQLSTPTEIPRRLLYEFLRKANEDLAR